MRKAAEKIKTLEELVPIVERLKAEGKRVVTTNGCFDLIHVGHAGYFEWAKDQGDVLILGLNTDSSVRENKTDLRPILPQEERIQVIAALEAIDYVFLFNEKTSIPFLGILKPNVHVKGGDYKLEQLIEREVVEQNGGEVRIAPKIHDRSTTSIINLIREKYGK